MRARKMTLVVERGDGESFDDDKLRALLNEHGYEVEAWGPGDSMLAESSMRRALEQLESAASLVKMCLPKRAQP